jgi:hypothetical protein
MTHHGETTPPPSPITSADLHGLATKLDGLHLAGIQKVVLSAIVAAAAEAAKPAPAIPSFSDQFATAFTPEAAARLISMTNTPASVVDIDPDQPPGT